MKTDRETIFRGHELLNLLDNVRYLRKWLEMNPSAPLTLSGKNGIICEQIDVPNIEPDLRLVVIDELLERVKARLGDIGIDE